MKIVVTGGAGFIGSALLRHIISSEVDQVLNIDCLTYAGNLDSLGNVQNNPRYSFSNTNICNQEKLENVFFSYQPDIIMHLAAESHVDRSIEGSDQFIETNIIGTFRLLEAARKYWYSLKGKRKDSFRFHHVSTDEVFGDLGETDLLFTENHPYEPSSPYSASKASSDHLVRSWFRTYGLPTVISNCSNNYGPYQFPEKLIPNTLLCAINGKQLPVYGNGTQVRDWLYVDDHVKALLLIAKNGKLGETYNIGGHNEIKNIEVIQRICDILEEMKVPKPEGCSHFNELISFVQDRPGHDQRYAIDANKIQNELNWSPEETFESGLIKTISWYLLNREWWESILSGEYKLERLGRI